MQSDVFVFIGPPGSGKGSLSQLCTQKFGWEQLSTGDLCRKHIAEQTEVGKVIDLAIKSGKLVSDDLIAEMVAEWFNKHAENFPAVILDGFPRTVAQAEAFDSLLSKNVVVPRLYVIRVTASDDVVAQRLSSRATCKNKECQRVYSLSERSHLASQKKGICDACGSELVRRKDDEPEAIKERLKVYHKHEQALLNFYRGIGKEIKELDGEKPLTAVFEAFQKLVAKQAANGG